MCPQPYIPEYWQVSYFWKIWIFHGSTGVADTCSFDSCCNFRRIAAAVTEARCHPCLTATAVAARHLPAGLQQQQPVAAPAGPPPQQPTAVLAETQQQQPIAAVAAAAVGLQYHPPQPAASPGRTAAPVLVTRATRHIPSPPMRRSAGTDRFLKERSYDAAWPSVSNIRRRAPRLPRQR